MTKTFCPSRLGSGTTDSGSLLRSKQHRQGNQTAQAKVLSPNDWARFQREIRSAAGEGFENKLAEMLKQIDLLMGRQHTQ